MADLRVSQAPEREMPECQMLERHLWAAAARPWAWGEHDCFLFVADWIECLTGIDPAGVYRGAYTTEREARRLMLAHGGPFAFAAARLETAGCVEVADPRRGDVGLVQVAVKRWKQRAVLAPVAAICVRPGFWAIRRAEARCLTFAGFPLLRAGGLR